MPDVPLRFLVGAARLIAIYFALRGIETTSSSIITYQMQLNQAAELGEAFPSVWQLLTPILALYFGLVCLTWFFAPLVCEFALRDQPQSEKDEEGRVSTNETMIFLVGVLFMGWALVRLSEDLMKLIPPKGTGGGRTLDAYTQIRLLITLGLAGCGGLMMSRFATIYRWIEKRKQQDVEPGIKSPD